MGAIDLNTPLPANLLEQARAAIKKASGEVSEQSEDAELNAFADSRKDQKRIKVNLDDL